jgi:ABC-type antimicrobial peptide transport system permease subunit
MTMAVGSFALSLTFFLGEGARIRLGQDMEHLMGNWVIASPGVRQNSHLLETRLRPDFTPEDFAFVKDHLKDVRLVAPMFQATKPVTFRNISRVISIDGVGVELSREPLFIPIAGRGFSDAGHQGLVWECLLTKSAVQALALNAEDEPTIFIDGRPFQVKGVTQDPPGADDLFRARITVPYESASVLWLPPGTIGEMLVAWTDPEKMDEVTRDLRSLLEICRGPDTFFLSSSEFKIQKSRSIVANFMAYGQVEALFCIGIAFVGVMNVMLTNTARRSREFAIRISMGARHHEILAAVLMESCFLGVSGALIGVVLSVLLAPYGSRLMQSNIHEIDQLLPYYGLKGFLYPIIVCGLAGLIAGVIPAARVRQLDVLASLRNNT